MSLLETAAADLQTILKDTDGGFAVSVTVTNPSGQSQTVAGLAADIGQTIDPETMQAVAGRTAHVTLPLAALTIGTPRGIADESSKPWLVSLQLPTDASARTLKVTETMPDKLGAIVCFLADYDT